MEDSILFFFFNLSFFSKYNGLISPLNGSSFFLFFFSRNCRAFSVVDERFEIQSYFPEERNQNARVWNQREIRWKKGESWWNGKRISPTCLHGINGSSLLNSSNDSFCTQNRIFKKKIWIHICLSFNKI